MSRRITPNFNTIDSLLFDTVWLLHLTKPRFNCRKVFSSFLQLYLRIVDSIACWNNNFVLNLKCSIFERRWMTQRFWMHWIPRKLIIYNLLSVRIFYYLFIKSAHIYYPKLNKEHIFIKSKRLSKEKFNAKETIQMV